MDTGSRPLTYLARFDSWHSRHEKTARHPGTRLVARKSLASISDNQKFAGRVQIPGKAIDLVIRVGQDFLNYGGVAELVQALDFNQAEKHTVRVLGPAGPTNLNIQANLGSNPSAPNNKRRYSC